MEAMVVSSIVKLSLITCGAGACKGQSWNAFRGSSSLSPQFFHPEDKQRKFAAAAAAEGISAVEGGGHLKTGTQGVGRERAKLVFASLAAGLANVQSALALNDDESALGLNYDELVGNVKEAAQSSSDSFNFDVPEVDTSALTDFVSTNPLAILGAGAVLALPLIVSTLFKKPEGYGTVTAKEAYVKLGDKELVSQMLDIRVGDDIKSEGTPNLKVYKKKVTQLPYIDEPDKYVATVLSKFKDAENTTIYILDRFDGNSFTVAKLLAKGGFKAAYAIQDGAEGPTGWQTSELPWLVPSKGFSLDFGGFKELLSTTDTGSIVPTTLGVAAAAGVGLVVFSEAETALQLLGSAALVQVFVKKFLFAKDRKKTFEELRAFLDTKVAPKELVDELKGIADVILPKFEEVQAATVNGAVAVAEAPASVEAEISPNPPSQIPAPTETISPLAETPSPVAETLAPEGEIPAPVAEAPAPEGEITAPVAETPAPEGEIPAPVGEIPAPVAETPDTAKPRDEELGGVEEPVSTTSTSSIDLPRTPKPLSPYGQYPGLKPPTSPTPTRP